MADYRQHIAIQSHTPLICGAINIGLSLFACGTCGYFLKWYPFVPTLLGIVVRGLAYLCIGTGEVVFRYPKPLAGSPPGDGILGDDQDFILLQGNREIVNAITRGEFFLSFQKWKHSRLAIQVCSTLFHAHAIVQVFCFPQSDLFGKVVVIIPIFITWAYHLWLAWFDEARIQQAVFDKVVGQPILNRFAFSNRTSAVAFLLSAAYVRCQPLEDHERLEGILDALLPPNTPEWKFWKAAIV